MRRSELALVLIRLNINSQPHLVLARHHKWGDWSLVGGHVEADERGDWARAAVRECEEELAPLRYQEDFILLPLRDQPVRWGPLPSRSANNEPTMYVAQLFSLRFLKAPHECLGRLPAGQFGIFAEADLVAVQPADDSLPLTVRAVRSVERSAVAWDRMLTAAPRLQS